MTIPAPRACCDLCGATAEAVPVPFQRQGLLGGTTTEHELHGPDGWLRVTTRVVRHSVPRTEPRLTHLHHVDVCAACAHHPGQVPPELLHPDLRPTDPRNTTA